MYKCGICDDVFYIMGDLRHHVDRKDHWVECETCDDTFFTQLSCHQHMNAKEHWAPRFDCETCDKDFRFQEAANQHMTSKNHWAPKIPCEVCDKKFYHNEAAKQHMTSKNHWAPKISCETCDKKFHSVQAANQHMDSLRHWARTVSCESCMKMFFDATAANQHMQDVGHWGCKTCNKSFPSENARKMHLNSKAHRQNDLQCPFCKSGFTSASGVSHHVESGSCPNARNINRETILDVIRQRDPNGVITNKQIEWHKESNISYTVTKLAFNGSFWECYICHDEFSTKNGLNSHVNSPVHKQKVYHCPNLKNCSRQFVSLGGLFGHLESETCAYMRFETVQQQVTDVLQGRKLIAF